MDETLDTRCQKVGLSLAQLARASSVPYRRIWAAENLRPDEQARIESVLAIAQRRQDRRSAITAA